MNKLHHSAPGASRGALLGAAAVAEKRRQRRPKLTDVSSSDPARFARLIVQRRRVLGLTTRDVQKAGGPSTPTLNRLEAGRVAQPSRDTLVKLDRALQWHPGSAARSFDGGLPETIEPAPRPSTSPAQPIVATIDGVMISTETLSSLVDLVDQVTRANEHRDISGREQLDELGTLVDRLLRSWIIVQAEVWKSQNELQRNEILINRMLGDQLRKEPDAARVPAQDLEDIGYLRWLLGRKEDADPAARHRWETRWETSQG